MITLSAPRPRWLLTTAVALLAIGASAPSLPNVFVQDDIPVVLKNPDNHSISTPWTASRPPLLAEAVQPGSLSSADVGRTLRPNGSPAGGSPLVFRITSILLYAASAVAFFWLAAMLLPVGAAWVAAALFAVHPVHVEAVAVAVNQGELVVGGIIASLWIGFYVIAPKARRPRPARFCFGFIASYVVACLFKENAVILPGLLIAAEMTLVTRDPRAVMWDAA